MIAVVTQLQRYHEIAIVLGATAGVFFVFWLVAYWILGSRNDQIKELKTELRDLHQEIRIFHGASSEIDRQFGSAFTEIQRRSRLG
jgi:hypothetical protein